MQRAPRAPVADTPLSVDNVAGISGGEKDYLGDPAVLDAMLRGFIADAVAVRDANNRLEPTAPEPGKWLADRASREARRLIGMDRDAIPVPEWNVDDARRGICAGIARRYRVTGQTAEEVAAFPFYSLAGTVVEAMRLAAKGEEFETLIDGEIETALHTLLGTDTIFFAEQDREPAR